MMKLSTLPIPGRLRNRKHFEHLFLGVGAAKSGTTWLYSVLSQHPDLCFSFEKELHYFAQCYSHYEPLSHSARMLRVKQRFGGMNPTKKNIAVVKKELTWFQRYLDDPIDARWYKAMFSGKTTEKYCVDFSNYHCLLEPDAWRKVQQYAADLKVLYVMRDPLERLWSHMKFHCMLNAGQENMSQWNGSDYKKYAAQTFIAEHTDYVSAVTRMREVLSEEQLLIGFYEHAHFDVRLWLRELEDFLGIGRFDYPDAKLEKRVNESAALPMPDEFGSLFASQMMEQIAGLENMGFEVPATWKTHY